MDTCIGLWYVYWYGLLFDIYSTPLLCFNSSTERMEVNVGSSVMMWLRLHLTGRGGQGLRLVNKMTKSKFGKSNGGKITRWPIKYPHVKKNAQRPKGLTYPASAKYPYENDRTITSNRSVEHTDSACQSGPLTGQRHLHGRHHTQGKHDREAI